jgi:hypothetical protein
MTTIFKFKLQFKTILLGTMTFVVIMALNDVLEIDQLHVHLCLHQGSFISMKALQMLLFS